MRVGRSGISISPRMADRLANSLSRARFIVPSTARIGQYRKPIILGLALLVVVETLWLVTVANAAHLNLGDDFRIYCENGATFLASGQFYAPEQLSGPYWNVLGHSVLYPPNALFLFVPLSLLPLPLAVLVWWGVPIAVTGYVLWSLRPSPWAWVGILLLMLWPHSIGIFLFGNSDMWLLAFVAAGVRWGWPAALVVLKPTLAPLALIGVRQRSWWIAAFVLGIASLPMLPLWADYLAAMRNLRDSDLAYSLGSLPLILVPVLAGYPKAKTVKLKLESLV